MTEQQKAGGPVTETAILGGGCFWCFETIFSRLRGVVSVEAGYSGGTVPNPTYERVCRGDTGHAETVRITYDPSVISYRQILEIFFAFHDPTTPNRQGADEGEQYRSVIFYLNEGQKAIAEDVMRRLEAEKVWRAPIVTELKPLVAFYRAEEYHQGYYEKNPGRGYCAFVIAPKVSKLKKMYAGMLADR